MLGKNAFYYNIIKKYIVAFGSLFNDIHVIRTDKNGVTVKDIKVPITFADKAKVAYQINSIHSRPNDIYSLGSILPRLSYTLNNSIEYDAERALNPLLQRAKKISGNTTNDDITTGRPFNFSFQLSIWTKYLDDMFQIIEQVLSFFHPDYHVTIKEIPELNIETSVPIVFQGCSPNIENEFEEQGQRVIKFDIDFILKGWIYPPINSNVLIENIQFNFLNDMNINNNVALVRNEFDEDINKYYSAIIESIDPYYESMETKQNTLLGNLRNTMIPSLNDTELYADLLPVVSVRVDNVNELSRLGSVAFTTDNNRKRFGIYNNGSLITPFDYNINNDKAVISLNTTFEVHKKHNSFVYIINAENIDNEVGLMNIENNDDKILLVSNKKSNVAFTEITSYLQSGQSSFAGVNSSIDITLEDEVNIESVYDINFVIMPLYSLNSQIGKVGKFGYKVLDKNHVRVFNNGESSISFIWCLLKAELHKIDISPVSQITLNVYKSDTEPVLAEDEYSAYWFNTDTRQRYFIQKLEDGTQTVTLL